MKYNIKSEQGFTLLELLLSMALTVLLLSGMLSLFATSLHIWAIEKNRTSMQQTARIATAKIVSEIRYARSISLNNTKSLKVTKLNGEIITFQLGGDLRERTLYMLIDKSMVKPWGGASTNPITENVVTNLHFTPYPQSGKTQAVGISIEVTDSITGEAQVLQTSGYSWNSH